MATLVMLSNYFHDVAVAILFCGVLFSWLIWRTLQKNENEAGRDFFITNLWRGIRIALVGSLAWIVVGGFIRAFTYMDYEWLPAAGRSQIVGLVIKHVLLVSMTGIGLYYYHKLSKKISQIKSGK